MKEGTMGFPGLSLTESQDAGRLYRYLIEKSADVIWTMDLTLKTTYMSPAVERQLGFTVTEYLTMKTEERLPPESYAQVKRMFAFSLDKLKKGELIRPDEVFTLEMLHRHKNGSLIWGEINYCFAYNDAGQPVGIIGITRNIHPRKMAEEKLKAALAEKELLLKEVHHRVKNNLMLIVSLLNLQARTLNDNRLKTILEDARNRVQTMMKLYQHLYYSGEMNQVRLNQSLDALIKGIYQHFHVTASSIVYETDFDECILDSKRSVSVSLILNELVTNAVRHAFPDSGNARIVVKLKKLPEGRIVFGVTDNGRGLPPDVDVHKPANLGLQIVQMLCNQLNGTLTVENSAGLSVMITIDE